MECRYKHDCKMFAYIREHRVREEFIAEYCEGPEREACARFQIRAAGGVAPLDLLPDGDTIQV